MLDVVEKVVAGFGVTCVLAAGLFYLIVGTPSTTPNAFIPNAKRLPSHSIAEAQPGQSQTAAIAEADKKILDKLRKQSPNIRRRGKLPREGYEVPAPLYEEVSKTANWSKQLKTARSRPIRTADGETRLEIYDIAPDSLLKKFGIVDNDIIELIDGDIIHFDQDSSTELYGIFKDKMEKLRSGDTISITVSRKNAPLHLEFQLPQ